MIIGYSPPPEVMAIIRTSRSIPAETLKLERFHRRHFSGRYRNQGIRTYPESGIICQMVDSETAL